MALVRTIHSQEKTFHFARVVAPCKGGFLPVNSVICWYFPNYHSRKGRHEGYAYLAFLCLHADRAVLLPKDLQANLRLADPLLLHLREEEAIMLRTNLQEMKTSPVDLTFFLPNGVSFHSLSEDVFGTELKKLIDSREKTDNGPFTNKP